MATTGKDGLKQIASIMPLGLRPVKCYFTVLFILFISSVCTTILYIMYSE